VHARGLAAQFGHDDALHALDRALTMHVESDYDDADDESSSHTPGVSADAASAPSMSFVASPIVVGTLLGTQQVE
jgi:hypothetical protein